jgi:protein-S-isoprenylcysteine O-methyltransferase Ste14
MKSFFWPLFLSFSSHLLICLLMTTIVFKLIIPIMPAAIPYAIVFDACFCLGILSIWYATSFDIDSWHVGAYIVIITVLILIFLFSSFEWAVGFDLIPEPWRYVAVFESLPLASMFIGFGVIITAQTNQWPASNKYSGERQPA